LSTINNGLQDFGLVIGTKNGALQKLAFPKMETFIFMAKK